jgi:hypothetical protein
VDSIGRLAHQHQQKNQPTGTTKARRGNPMKSRSATAASWSPFSTESGVFDLESLKKIAIP